MSPRNVSRGQRIEELLIEQAVFGLDQAAQAELDALRGDAGGDTSGRGENPWFETAALVQLGLAAMDRLHSGDSGMPGHLRERIAADLGRRN